jgi:hypothetical protein
MKLHSNTRPPDRSTGRLLHFVAALFLFSAAQPMRGQDSTFVVNERLLLDLPLIDAPYVRAAADMAYNKRLGLPAGGATSPTLSDWLSGYESPSMQQSLAITKNLHGTNYYFTNKLWNGWITPTDRKSHLLNRVVANAQAGLVDYALAYKLMVFGPAWMHEEFHRAVLTLRGISTFDETYYRFGGGIPSASVSHVFDADMMRFKQEAPNDLVRSFAAGIEAQYALVRNMQQDNFFQRTDYPNVAMNILITNQAVNYVRQFQAPDYDQSIDTMNFYGEEIPERDFVGWDFTAWVYDLHRPDEPCEARGPHPFGEGINRAIKRSQLTDEEDDYLMRMGDLQYLNFLSPDMIGIHGFRIAANTRFNFSVHHILTSFGYDLGGDLLLDHKGKQWMLGVHTYHNRDRSFAGVELVRRNMRTGRGEGAVMLDLRGMLWMQPENGGFFDQEGTPGGLLTVRAGLPLGRSCKVYAEAEGKTEGWVMANPFLDQNLSMRFGLSWDIHK